MKQRGKIFSRKLSTWEEQLLSAASSEEVQSGAAVSPSPGGAKLEYLDEQLDAKSKSEPDHAAQGCVRWVGGCTLLLINSAIGTLTTVGLSTVNGAINPYTKRALGFSLALCVCITWILLRRLTVKVSSSKQFFLIIGSITFLSVGDLFYAHAAMFTPLHSLQGLFINWGIIGSLLFLRFFCKRHLTALRLLCVGICSLGCTLAAQPQWFSTLDVSEIHANHSSVSPNQDHYVEINANIVIPLKITHAHRHVNFNISSLKIPHDSITFADYFIGCMIASISGLFHGAWLTVMYIMKDISVSVLIFWSCLTCSFMSFIMMFASDIRYFPYCYAGVTFLLIEAVGTCLTMVGTAVAARLTNPIMATSILSVSLLLNYPAACLPTGGYNGKLGYYVLSWTEILGCCTLLPGVLLCIFLEVKSEFFTSPKEENKTETVLVKNKSNCSPTKENTKNLALNVRSIGEKKQQLAVIGETFV